jgi:hypothetical protein
MTNLHMVQNVCQCAHLLPPELQVSLLEVWLQLQHKCAGDHAALAIMHKQARQQLVQQQRLLQAKEQQPVQQEQQLHAAEQLSAHLAEAKGAATCISAGQLAAHCRAAAAAAHDHTSMLLQVSALYIPAAHM